MTTTLRVFAVIGLYLINAYERHADKIDEWLYDYDAESPVLDALVITSTLVVLIIAMAAIAII